MSGLLFGIGAFAALAGAVMIGFGVPINEFSFGNTLILAGTTAVIGGLIVIGLGFVVAKLQRIAETLATRAPIRSSRTLDLFESAAASRNVPAAGRIPFPPKPKSETGVREPHPPEPRASVAADMPGGEGPVPSFAPSLRNPDEGPVTVDDEVSLSPQHPMAAPAADLDEPARYTPPFDIRESETAEKRREPTPDAGWRSVPPPPAPPPPAPPRMRQTQSTYFDAMWPAEPRSARSPADTDTNTFEPKPDLPAREPAAAPAKSAEPEAVAPRPESEPRAVAILKSGVVDGMGYTLYVDGSIEAELPQGTLRFASINELRSHLEKSA